MLSANCLGVQLVEKLKNTLNGLKADSAKQR